MARLNSNPLQDGLSRFTHAFENNGTMRHVFTILLAVILVGLIAGALMLGANEGASQYGR
jgi:hypothetical protein